MVVLPINSTHRMNCCNVLVIIAETTKIKKTRCALHRISYIRFSNSEGFVIHSDGMNVWKLLWLLLKDGYKVKDFDSGKSPKS